MILGSIQPSYLSWLPFYKRVVESDIFVLLDDVKFSKNSFHNKTKINTRNGVALLTVPILYTGNSRKNINEIEIDYSKNWQKKHWMTIHQNYANSAFFSEFSEDLKNILYHKWPNLGSLNIEIVNMFLKYFNHCNIPYKSSDLNLKETGNEKLIKICQHFGASSF